MSTVIWIPFRGDNGGWRTQNFETVYAQAESLGFPVWVEDSGDQPFSIARTWNQLGARGGWDQAVCWGADFVLVDPNTVHAALATGHHYVFAFDRVSTLTAQQTTRVFRSGPQKFPVSKLPFGGIRAISRAMFEDVGGYDPRFIGWGHEDRSFVHAMSLLWGPPARVAGHMLNLWHPKKTDDPGSPYFGRRHDNQQIWREYQAITTAHEMRRFLRAR